MERTFLAILLVVGVNLSLTAGDSSATWDDFRKSSAVWANKHFKFSAPGSPELFGQLTSAATAGNDANSASGGWMAQCHNLSDGLEKSWNLTVVVAEANWPVVENVAETLYTMLLSCTETGITKVIPDAACLIKNLVVMKNVLVPAVKMNVDYAQQAWHLVPEFVKAAKECLTF